MLMEPKGFKYWRTDKNGNNFISENAPDWAKEEFEEYRRIMKSGEEADTNGNINSI